MSEDDDEWPPRPMVVDTDAHPEYDRDAAYTAWDVVYLLQPGDAVLWEGRSIPLKVQTVQSTMPDTMRGRAVRSAIVAGPRGGEYRITNWVHWGENDDVYGPDNPKGRYPQVIGMSSSYKCHLGVDDARFGIVADADAPWTRWDADADAATLEAAAPAQLMFRRPDEPPRLGDVVEWEYGQPVVRPIHPDGPPESVPVDRVIGYRREVAE